MDTVAAVPNLAEFEIGPSSLRDPEGRVLNGAGIDQSSYKYCYWRKPDGYLTVGGYWPTARADQSEQGWEPLRRYGYFLLENAEEGWRVNQEPWRRLFQRGGAHEFSVAEIVEHQWHVKPPYQGVIFPQLEGADLPASHVCTMCPGKRTFNSAADLEKHELIMHKETTQNQQLARNLADANRPGVDAVAEAISKLSDGQMAQSAVLAQLIERQSRTDEALAAVLTRLLDGDTPKGKGAK